MTVTVSTLTCGWLTGSASGFLDGEPGVMRVPVLSFLVEHPKGRVLFDSGLAAELADDTAAAGRMAELFEMDFGRQDAIDRRLSAAEVCEAGDIAVLVNSHLHFDHCGGNALVPNARVVVQAAEWRAGHHEKLVASDTYSPALFDIGQDVQLIDGEHDLFGDGRVVCIPTPGHTPGHQSLRVRTDHGEVVLCGDACYLRKALDELHLPDFAWNKEQQLASLHALAALEAAGAQLFFGHDPVQWSSLPHAGSRPHR
ncbi:MAG: N-acyl homoserine lactonase family protein [Acidimicrobiia bacterium]